MSWYDPWLENGWIPDYVIRFFVRQRCRERLSAELNSQETKMKFLQKFIRDISSQPIAIATNTANRQHYEVSTAFFQGVLGARLKYSCCYWKNLDSGSLASRLDKAEEAMLSLTCKRADLQNGMTILDLGCGWGSMSLFVAEKYPDSRITAVTNSDTQKKYLDQQASLKKLNNLTVIKSDMNTFHLHQKFDRIVSVEMFEHMRNIGLLFDRISGMIRPGGKLFIHIFTYAGNPYLYDDNDHSDWMARNFFAGGMMPCPELLGHFTSGFSTEKIWQVGGVHYQKTLQAWLQKMDAGKSHLYPLFLREYGTEARKYWNHWRIFFMSCAEVFGYQKGNRWYVTHYLFVKTQ
jgi:cyclopropane fatty-acyl-phospholipid synthase-like methyltransferase